MSKFLDKINFKYLVYFALVMIALYPLKSFAQYDDNYCCGDKVYGGMDSTGEILISEGYASDYSYSSGSLNPVWWKPVTGEPPSDLGNFSIPDTNYECVGNSTGTMISWTSGVRYINTFPCSGYKCYNYRGKQRQNICNCEESDIEAPPPDPLEWKFEATKNECSTDPQTLPDVCTSESEDVLIQQNKIDCCEVTVCWTRQLSPRDCTELGTGWYNSDAASQSECMSRVDEILVDGATWATATGFRPTCCLYSDGNDTVPTPSEDENESSDTIGLDDTSCEVVYECPTDYFFDHVNCICKLDNVEPPHDDFGRDQNATGFTDGDGDGMDDTIQGIDRLTRQNQANSDQVSSQLEQTNSILRNIASGGSMSPSSEKTTDTEVRDAINDFSERQHEDQGEIVEAIEELSGKFDNNDTPDNSDLFDKATSITDGYQNAIDTSIALMSDMQNFTLQYSGGCSQVAEFTIFGQSYNLLQEFDNHIDKVSPITYWAVLLGFMVVLFKLSILVIRDIAFRTADFFYNL
jgi:hypothetical protein